MSTKKSTLYIRGLPREVKNSFKATCSRREVTMTDVMAALMRLYVANPAVVDPKRQEAQR